MQINVKFDIERRRLLYPEVAVVKRGDIVTWTFEALANYPRRLTWTIYFDGRTPFNGAGKVFKITTEAEAGRHRGYLVSGYADENGEYKYGIRLADANSTEPLGDDDPFLIVRN